MKPRSGQECKKKRNMGENEKSNYTLSYEHHLRFFNSRQTEKYYQRELLSV